MVVFTNNMLRTYFITDIVYHVCKFKSAVRKDLIFHHVLIVIPFLVVPKVIAITFPIMAEVYSTGALFYLSPTNDLRYRAFLLMTIRLFIWISLFRMSFLGNQTLLHICFMRSVSTGMLALDGYWLKLIYAKLSKPHVH
jgi:hypothetical protein